MPADPSSSDVAAPGTVRISRARKEPKPNLERCHCQSPFTTCAAATRETVDLINIASSHNLTVCPFSLSTTGPTILCPNKSQCCRPSHLVGWSDAWLGAADGAADIAGCTPLSWGGAVPHFGSPSNGSTTWTLPSLMPSAIWLGSMGWAATTNG